MEPSPGPSRRILVGFGMTLGGERGAELPTKPVGTVGSPQNATRSSKCETEECETISLWTP